MPDKSNMYFIDTGTEAELTRLIKQDKLFNKHIPLLPPDLDPWENTKILDLACGPGGWALEVVAKYPQIQVVGIDIDEMMIAYARAEAQVQEREERTEFIVGDILKPLDFADESIDFINSRLLQGFMFTSQWDPLLNECFRVTRPGGIVRLIEMSNICTAGCPNMHRIQELVDSSFWQAQRTFSQREAALTPMLGYFLEQSGYRVLSEDSCVINVSFGTEMHKVWIQCIPPTLQLIKPFLRKYHPGLTVEEMDMLCEGTLKEMADPSFRQHYYFTSVMGQKAIGG